MAKDVTMSDLNYEQRFVNAPQIKYVDTPDKLSRLIKSICIENGCQTTFYLLESIFERGSCLIGGINFIYNKASNELTMDPATSGSSPKEIEKRVAAIKEAMGPMFPEV